MDEIDRLDAAEKLLQRVIQGGRWDYLNPLMDSPWVIPPELRDEIKRYIDMWVPQEKTG